MSPAPLPADVVFHANWWSLHSGITFDEDFFFHTVGIGGTWAPMHRPMFTFPSNSLYRRHWGLGKIPRP